MNFIKKTILFFMLVLPMTQAIADKSAEKPAKKTKPLPEVCMGDSKAPVKIFVYTSLTCPHCAHFHRDVVPQVETKYIKPGYVWMVFRDFPGDKVSLEAHQVAWCKGEIKYLDFVDLIYSNQDKWLTAKDPIAALKEIMLKNGISSEQFDAAIKNAELMDKIVQARLEGQKKYKITATPTIIISGKIYPRALTFKEIDEILQPLLKKPDSKDGEKKKEEKKDLAKEDKERSKDIKAEEKNIDQEAKKLEEDAKEIEDDSTEIEEETKEIKEDIEKAEGEEKEKKAG
jgi:protein-disulfide isomerase